MDLETIQCRICNRKFNNTSNLNMHMNEHFVNYTCEKCGKGFATKTRYMGHLRRHTVGTFRCGQCDRVFETENKLYNHRAAHFKRNKCKHCPETFKSFHQKNKHMRDVHGVPDPYACKHCDKTFIIQCSLVSHVQRHHSVRVRKFNCDICDKEFFDRATLRLHAIVHAKIDKFPCTICSKRFKRKKNLKQHLKIHLDIRDFQCAYCGQDFVQKCSLQSHMRKHKQEF